VTAVAGVVDGAKVAASSASAFGVFYWLEIIDFDLFFVFLLFLCFVLLVLHVLVFLVCCFCCVSDTEQQLMPALNVLFWNQVI
jgi:hypothetical protein